MICVCVLRVCVFVCVCVGPGHYILLAVCVHYEKLLPSIIYNTESGVCLFIADLLKNYIFFYSSVRFLFMFILHDTSRDIPLPFYSVCSSFSEHVEFNRTMLASRMLSASTPRA